jgi:hypothetical protein
MDPEQKRESIAELKRLGATEVKDQSGKKVKAWKLLNGPEMCAHHLQRALAKQKKILDGTAKKKIVGDWDVSQELKNEGWVFFRERVGHRTRK